MYTIPDYAREVGVAEELEVLAARARLVVHLGPHLPEGRRQTDAQGQLQGCNSIDILNFGWSLGTNVRGNFSME